MDTTILTIMGGAVSALFGLLMKTQQDRITEKDKRIESLESELKQHTDSMARTADALQNLTAAIKEVISVRQEE